MIHRRLLACVLTLALAAPAVVRAQVPGPKAPTPAACNATLDAFEHAALAARRETGMTYAQIIAAKGDSARACLARLATPPAAVPDSSLLELGRLYATAGDTVALSATVTRYLSVARLSDSARASRMAAAVPVLMADNAPGRLAEAGRLVARLDGMGPAVAAQQVAAHAPLLSYYRMVDVDSGIAAHASRVIAVLPVLNPAQRTAASPVLVRAFTTLAQVYGGRAQADSALALLARGKSTLADLPDAAPTLDAEIARYSLVGRPGAAIVGTRWLNAPSSTTRLDPAGQVTLVQFSAHWCGPCRKSYDAMTRIQNAYTPRGLRTVFVTGLYGFFKNRQNLTPEQEIAADSEYYFVEHKLPVQLAISPSATDTVNGGAVDINVANYKVYGLPQIVVLDRTGVVRMIVVGWDPASEDRIRARVEALLADVGSGGRKAGGGARQ